MSRKKKGQKRAYYVHCQSSVYTVNAISASQAGKFVFLATGADDYIIKIEKKRD